MSETDHISLEKTITNNCLHSKYYIIFSITIATQTYQNTDERHSE